jgi:small subunit ribosomal protein S2
MPDALFVIDPRREYNAVREAKRIGIPVVALLDTDSNPDPIDIPIPGNDDSMRTIQIILQKLADAIITGQAQHALSPRPEESEASAPAAGASERKPDSDSRGRDHRGGNRGRGNRPSSPRVEAPAPAAGATAEPAKS